MIVCTKCGKERPNQAILRGQSNHGLSKTGLCRICFLEARRNRKFEVRKHWRRSDGYYEVAIPRSHPFFCMAAQSRQTILVHRLVMAEHLGRPLLSNEDVHHINGKRDDNRIENLQLVKSNTHPLSYTDGYEKGIKNGLVLRDRELEKQIKILQEQIKNLSESLQLKLKVYDSNIILEAEDILLKTQIGV